MKKLSTLFILSLLPLLASPFEVDDIYYQIVNGNQAEVVARTSRYSGNVIIPSTVEYGGVTYSVTIIGDFTFYYCTRLTSITIPNSVTTIGEYNQEIKGETNVEIIPVSA